MTSFFKYPVFITYKNELVNNTKSKLNNIWN